MRIIPDHLWTLEKSFEESEIAEDISVDVQNYETWLQNKDEIGEFYDARATLENLMLLKKLKNWNYLLHKLEWKLKKWRLKFKVEHL